MTTPQYVPPEFQNEIDIPAPQVNREALAEANRNFRRAQGRVNDPRIKAIRQKLFNDNLRHRLTGQARKRAFKRLRVLEKRREEARKARDRYREQRFILTGRFDLLLQGEQRDAYSALRALFNSYGLGSLANNIYEYAKQGYGADTISLMLQDTKEYKERFAANEARRKKGLPVLSPAEYLAAESSYRQILSSAGLPKGFYDNPADFTNWLAGDVSPTEIQSRVDLAVQATTQANPEYKKALKAMYGVNETELTAYFLDKDRAVPLLERRAAAAQIGAAALRRGFQADRTAFENYATMGISADQAEEGFALIGETYKPMQAIAERFGLTWTQRTAEQEVFIGGNAASSTGKRLRSQERALFGSRAGGARAGLSGGYRQT
jgi:hypothetical protein